MFSLKGRINTLMRCRLYAQLVMVCGASLLAFAIVTSLIWRATGHDRYEGEMFQLTTSLAMMLLPPVDSDVATQQQALQTIGDNLNFDITLWSPDGQTRVARGPAAQYPTGIPLKVGAWIPTSGLTTWSTILPDGRVVVIYLDRIQVPDDTTGFVISMLVLALFINLLAYPFIRRLTKRLEVLQHQVKQIGEGDLSARVEVLGTDEVASLATSFNDAAAKIEALVTAQRMLLANASHELRTPLARIKLAIDLQQEQDCPARRQAMQEDIQELDQLIDELILMTRLDTDAQPKAFASVDLMGLAAEECARYPDCELSGSQAEITGDARMLRHMLRNLLDNAWHHGKAPVSVDIQASPHQVALTVFDAGTGIPEALQEQVFQPFFRGPDKQNVPGYGLGLALVQRIAAVHQARIAIANRPQSAITLIFPTALASGHVNGG